MITLSRFECELFFSLCVTEPSDKSKQAMLKEGSGGLHMPPLPPNIEFYPLFLHPKILPQTPPSLERKNHPSFPKGSPLPNPIAMPQEKEVNMPPFPSPHSALEPSAHSSFSPLSLFVCRRAAFWTFVFGVARPLKLRAHFEDAAETRQSTDKDQFVRLEAHSCSLCIYNYKSFG